MVETVEDGKNGILVDPNDVHGFSNAIGRIFSDKRLAQSMGQESLRLAKEKFDWKLIAGQTKTVYTEVCGGK
jgi:glycosyltransferase involved in cell wall biosynthesis